MVMSTLTLHLFIINLVVIDDVWCTIRSKIKTRSDITSCKQFFYLAQSENAQCKPLPITAQPHLDEYNMVLAKIVKQTLCA